MPQLPITAKALVHNVFQNLFPLIEKELTNWQEKAEQIPNDELRIQALASIQNKKFHCQGGGVFALLAGENKQLAIRFIVAYQTISDYLDNLCDRSTSLDPKDFRMLHVSMKDALQPKNEIQNYYAFRKEQDDGGYLEALVLTCQECLKQMEDYEIIAEKLLKLKKLYIDLQVHKHVVETEREARLKTWYEANKDIALGLTWYEFAAAAGSTLGIFCLVSYGFAGKMNDKLADQIMVSYFPYVQGLHILLDYYIDQKEDKEEGDLNFCSYYRDDVQIFERFEYFYIQAEKHVSQMPDKRFHQFIPKGLVGLYLSDEKTRELEQSITLRKKLIQHSGFTGRFIHYTIKIYYKYIEGK
ncbi:tetraprenyl-beta-curcumene synthase family protein [Oceanobacillus sp. CAU 1775]